MRLGMFETPVSAKQPQRCRKCGYGGLYWHDSTGPWLLHHWSCSQEGDKPRFVLHRCGFDSSGTALQKGASHA